MNIYLTILVEFLFLSSSILLLFRFRSRLGLAPLYIFLGTIQCLEAFSGTVMSFEILDKYTIYPGSVIIFSAVLFSVLLIYIKAGVTSARTLITGIIISNFLLSALLGISYLQDTTLGLNDSSQVNPVFILDYTYFITGTIILFFDFILLVILYQVLITKIRTLNFFLILFVSLSTILIFDSLAFNLILKFNSQDFTTLLTGHIIGKSVSAFVFSLILYVYLKFLDNEDETVSLIATQNRDIFSIIKYRKKYLDLKVEKKETEKRLTSQLEMSLNNISDGFVSLDTNWCYTYINKIAADFLGKSPESLIGKHIWTEFPEGRGSSIYNAYHEAVKTQNTIHIDNYYKPLDMWFENRIYPSTDGLTIYYTDITEKKKADTNNQMLLSLIETSDDFVGLANLDGQPIYLNANGRQLVGFDADGKMPPSISDFFPQNYQEIIKNEHIPAIFENDKWNGEAHFINIKTGDLIPIDMSGFLIRDSTTAKPLALGIVATDITERKKTEENLINSEKLFRQLTSNAPVAIFKTDKEGACNFVNEEWITYAQMPFEEAMGFGWANAIHPEDKERVLNEWQQTTSTGNKFESEFRFQNANGHVIWLATRAVGLYDAQNNLYGYIGMASDMTEQKKSEEALIETKKYLDNIINNIGDPVFVKDDQSRFLLANSAFYNLFNRTKEEILGKTFAEDVPQEERERHLRNDNQVLSKGIENIAETNINGEDGETRIISTKKTRFIDEYGKIFLIGTIRDITKSKKAEEQIVKSEKYLENIINNIGDPVFVKDDQSRLLVVNDALCNSFGLARADIIGKTLAEDVSVTEQELFLRIDKEVISNGVENVNEESITIRNNKTRIISTKKTRFIDSDGNKFLIGVIRDITERKNAEEAIKESEEKFSKAFRSNVMGLAIINEDKQFVEINDSLIKLFDSSRKKIIGKTIVESKVFDVDNPYNQETRNLIWAKFKENGHVKDFELQMNLKSGKKLFGIISMERIELKGKPHTLITVNDITEKKKANEVIIQKEKELSIIYSSLTQPVFILEVKADFKYEFISISKSFSTIIGVEQDDIINKYVSDVIPEPSLSLVLEKYKTAVLQKTMIQWEETTMYKTGLKTAIVTINPILDKNDNCTHLVGIVYDITERKQTEIELENHRNNLEDIVDLRTSELEKEKIKAQSADLMKSAFLATMSHELRTPMNSIIGFTGILLKEFAGPLNDEQKKQLSMVKTSGQHLLGLINDILDISKIEAGKLNVSLYPFNYLTTLEKTIAFLVPQASKKTLNIILELSETEIIINSDERRVEQVLLNFLSNAIKFSDNGTIQVKVDINDDFVVTQIIDHGIGISVNDLNKLFMPFIQLDDGGLSRSHEGTGLGLAICKSLVEKLEGTIDVKSKLGEGSNFTFTLPIKKAKNN